MSSEWFKEHEKVSLLREAAYTLAERKKDYRSAIKSLLKATNLIKKSTIFDSYYKAEKLSSCYRLLTLYSMKIGDLDAALEYARLYNDPGYLGDIYFEKKQYDKCLDSYSLLSGQLTKQRIKKVVVCFYELIKTHNYYYIRHPNLKYKWLYNYIIEHFSSIDNAFLNYNSYKQQFKKKTRYKLYNKFNLQVEKEKNQWLNILQSQKKFEKNYKTKLTVHIGKLINSTKFQQAEQELLKLYQECCRLEELTEHPSSIKYDLITAITEIYLLNNKLEDALQMAYEHIDHHWTMCDYYLNVKFLLNRRLSGKDIVAIGNSPKYRNNVGIHYNAKFYSASPFTMRHKEGIAKICDSLLKNLEKDLNKPYLTHLSKIVASFRDEAFLGGEFGEFRINRSTSIPKRFRIWVKYDFCRSYEFNRIISDMNLEAENCYRLSIGMPERGKGWTSENEIFVYVKDLLAFVEVKQHYKPSWLSPMHLDIYVPAYDIAIEYQGKQHYEPVDYFGGEEAFKQQKVRDKTKAKLCAKHNIKLLYVRYDDTDPETTVAKFLARHSQ